MRVVRGASNSELFVRHAFALNDVRAERVAEVPSGQVFGLSGAASRKRALSAARSG